MGVRELAYCNQQNANLDSIGNYNYYWGCDFALIRILVPDWVEVKAEKLAKRMPNRGTSLTAWFSPHQISHYKIKKYFGSNDNVFVADLEKAGYVVQPGWSGSPILNSNTQEVVGIISSGWPGASSMMGVYSITYAMDNLGAKSAIENDYNLLKKGWSTSSGPYKGNFHDEWEMERLGRIYRENQ